MIDEVSSGACLRESFCRAECAHVCFLPIQDMLIEIDDLRAENQELQLQALAHLRTKLHLPAQAHV